LQAPFKASLVPRLKRGLLVFWRLFENRIERWIGTANPVCHDAAFQQAAGQSLPAGVPVASPALARWALNSVFRVGLSLATQLHSVPLNEPVASRKPSSASSGRLVGVFGRN